MLTSLEFVFLKGEVVIGNSETCTEEFLLICPTSCSGVGVGYPKNLLCPYVWLAKFFFFYRSFLYLNCCIVRPHPRRRVCYISPFIHTRRKIYSYCWLKKVGSLVYVEKSS